MDPARELNVLTTAIYEKEEAVEEEKAMIVSAGIDAELVTSSIASCKEVIS